VRRWWLTIALLLSLGVNAGILAVIVLGRLLPERAAPRAAARGAGVERLADRLGLAGEERHRFVALQERFLLDTREQRQRLAGLRRELRRRLVERHPDERRIEELVGEMSAATSALDRALVRLVLDSRKLLGPRQQREYFRFLARLRMGEPPLAPRRWRPFQRRPPRPIEEPEGELPEDERGEPGPPG
jgi:hypothetical protein